MSAITQKICLLGDFSVGKTSLVRRFIEDKFSDNYLSTVGVKVSRKSLNLKTELETKQVNLLVWDLEGHTKFKGITPSYLKGASGSIIVADLTRINTLDNLNKHIELFSDINPQGKCIVAFNKADLIQPEKLSKILELYNFINYSQVVNVYPTSAKTGQEVNNIFEELTGSILHSKSS